MSTALDLRQALLIYCLQRLPDGSYVALNRAYKPLGDPGPHWVDYKTAPGRFKFKTELARDQVVALSCNADPDSGRIYLYNDGCVPSATDADWAAYQARVRALVRLTVEFVAG